MRIAYVVADAGIPVFGTKGASVHVQEFIRALGQEHEVDLFCAALGNNAHDLPVRSLHHQVRPPIDSSGDAALDRDLARIALVDAMTARVAAAHSVSPYDFIYERYSLFSTVGVTLARCCGLPFLVEVNAPLIAERKRVEALPLEALASEREASVFRGADAVLCVSDGMASYVRTKNAVRDRIHILPNAVDSSRFHPAVSGKEVQVRYGLQSTFTVGFVGSLKAWHGVDVLIAAFQGAAEAHWRLLLVGEGPERDRLKELARDLGIDGQVLFTGAIHHDDVPAHVAALDIAVAPYRGAQDFYFSPLKLYEYLAAGRAVIASDIGQISEIVRHGDNGYLVPPDDVEALTAGLRQLGGDVALRRRLQGRASRGLPSWNEVTRRVLDIAQSTVRAA